MQVFKNNVSLEATPTGDTHVTNKGYVDRLCGGQLPIGAIVPFSGSVIPYGYLLCDGQEISRAKYSTLFSVIGEIFGSGDGSTTFNVPDLRDKFPQGASGSNPVGTVKEAGLPNITGGHTTYDYAANTNDTTGAFTKHVKNPNSSVNIIVDSEAPYTKFSFDASRSSSIYGKSNTVQPPSVCVNYIIRAKVAETTTLTGEAKESYSTEEQVIGTWIDGKPLYRRVIEVESLICTTVFNESTLIEDTSNINIKSIRGSVKWGDSIVPFPFYFDRIDATAKILIDTSCYDNKFALRYSQTSGIQQINIGVSLIIEYTKTTD